ncbi:TerC/Alx family metal homeostasis membrane protein [Vibrio ziniensis]|uniref:TerC/Alx family metal homeostasis membrane protein n=1 Tax=Vibrio ziniensis TaxID=2711221 RepID=A0A6G7CRE2_9VIBR|nr:TerC/Alx family metal homeostasis membrane protein [Vibrio ziniensis]QIH44568.1 TerC/Alx family metal homeostasis membrane protein [Vibrio ziniensis]
MSVSTYISFAALTVILVCLDIWQTRGSHITIRKAVLWSLFWFSLAFVFAVSIYHLWDIYAPDSNYTPQKATISFITGYLLEKSLSVDNLFMFAVIFHQYNVPEHLRPRALLWGVVGALLLRAIMIVLGSELLSHYHWVMYLFAAFLIWTGFQLMGSSNEQETINPMPERLMRKVIPVTNDFKGQMLFHQSKQGWVATPMLVVIAVIAFMDVMFALDSIPAIFAVTQEPFLVLAANVFALLGLRSLYFVLQGMMDKFIYLKPALSFIMLFIGVKMILVGSEWEIPTYISLFVLLGTMTVAVVCSLLKQRIIRKNKLNQIKSIE